MAEKKNEAGSGAPEVGKSEPEETAKKLISDEDYKAMYSGPAVATNRFFLTITQDGARLAFMEQYGEKVPAQFRTAVSLSFANLQHLRDLLDRQLKRITPIHLTKEETEELVKRQEAQGKTEPSDA